MAAAEERASSQGARFTAPLAADFGPTWRRWRRGSLRPLRDVFPSRGLLQAWPGCVAEGRAAGLGWRI